jgi:hypothetical protein
VAAVALGAGVAAGGCAGRADGSAGSGQGQRGSAPAGHARASPAALRQLAAEYLVIAGPANRRLDHANDAYDDAEHDDLAAARAALRSEAATERWFDAHLAAIRFPAPIAPIAGALIKANDRRIALTRRQASSATLASVRAFDHRHKAADAAVEEAVRIIRKQLGLPPPSTS